MPDHEDWVEITHAGVEPTATVAPESVAFWENLGWTRVADNQASPTPGAQPSEQAQPASQPQTRPDVKAGGNR